MIKDLEEKSLHEEKKVSENNVNIENLHMNVALNHKTIMGLQEDHKELIDQNTRDIEMLKNKPPVEIPEMPDVGDGLNMAQLMNIFASKNPPDSTIVRIEELEKQVKDLMAREPVKEIREIKEVRTEVQAQAAPVPTAAP